MNSPQVSRESKHYLAILVSERAGFIYSFIEWYRVRDRGKSGQPLAPDPHDPRGHKRKIYVDRMFAFRDQYISILGPPVFESKPEKFKNAINATDPPTSYYRGDKKESEQGGRLKARDEIVNRFFNMKHPLLHSVNSDESFTESEYDEIRLKIIQVDRKVAPCIEQNCQKIPDVFRRELERFGDVQPATPEPEVRQEIENRSIPMSENGSTKDDPRRWLIRLPKDELKARLKKHITRGEDIKDSFDLRPLPSETKIEGPKFSTRPPFPPLPKQRAKRSGIPKAPDIGAKPKPKYWQLMRLSSVKGWQSEFSSWDNLIYSTLQKGYYSREAYRDYCLNPQVTRVQHYSTKNRGEGDIIIDWIFSFIQAYDEKIIQLKRYLHELENYEFKKDIEIPQGEKDHPAVTLEKSLGEGQLIGEQKKVNSSYCKTPPGTTWDKLYFHVNIDRELRIITTKIEKKPLEGEISYTEIGFKEGKLGQLGADWRWLLDISQGGSPSPGIKPSKDSMPGEAFDEDTGARMDISNYDPTEAQLDRKKNVKLEAKPRKRVKSTGRGHKSKVKGILQKHYRDISGNPFDSYGQPLFHVKISSANPEEDRRE